MGISDAILFTDMRSGCSKVSPQYFSKMLLIPIHRAHLPLPIFGTTLFQIPTSFCWLLYIYVSLCTTLFYRNFSYTDTNVIGARLIARCARQAGVERLVHVSHLNAAPDREPLCISEGSWYLRTKVKELCIHFFLCFISHWPLQTGSGCYGIIWYQ